MQAEGNPKPRPYLIVLSAGAVVVAVAVLGFALSWLALEDPWAHASTHILGAAAAATFLVLALRIWPAPSPARIAHNARRLLVVGLAVFAVGQAFEALGAWGYDGNRRVSGLAQVHDVALQIGTLGLLLTMFAAGGSVAIAGAARFDLLESRWFTAMVVAVIVLVVLFVIGGFIFGY